MRPSLHPPKLTSYGGEQMFSKLPFRALLALTVVGGTWLGLSAQKPNEPLVWIKPSNPYANYLEAAVQKKHTPVQFTILKKKAQYLAELDATARKGSTWRAVFTGQSGRASALSLSVVNLQTGVIVFSYTCHKGGHAFGFGGHEGFQSAAECLAKHWTHFIKHGKP